MEDILASIRRILSEDEQASPRGAEPPREPPKASGESRAPEVFNLEASMMVDEAPQPPERPEAEPTRPEIAMPPPAPPKAPPPAAPQPQAAPPAPPPLRSEPPPASPVGTGSLVAPAAAAAAAMSLGSLRRTIEAERPPPPRGGGLTVEELAREELRPVLKAWLDEHLAPIVERLVRAEIERVVGRSDV